MGRYDDARERATEAVALAERAGSAAALASARIALSNCWLDLGYYERAIERYEAGLAHNDAHGLIHHGNICLLNIALCRIELGHWDDAERTLARLEDPERRLVERMRSVVAFNGALLAEGRGDHDTAWRRFDASRAIRQRLGQGPLMVDSLAGLLRVAVATEDMPALSDLVVELETRVAAQGTIGIEHLGRLHLAMYAGHRTMGDVARAATWLSDALALLGDRADQLADPNHRESYLTRPPSHRQLLALARSHGLAVPETWSV
jgi:tetratricopeptide (TPR) repeat protein